MGSPGARGQVRARKAAGLRLDFGQEEFRVKNYSTGLQATQRQKDFVFRGGAVQSLDLVRDLAELERELAKKQDEARRSAEQKIASAEKEARRILADADLEIRQVDDNLKARIAEESKRLAEDGRSRAETETGQIRRQAEANMDWAVNFVLSKVVP